MNDRSLDQLWVKAQEDFNNRGIHLALLGEACVSQVRAQVEAFSVARRLLRVKRFKAGYPVVIPNTPSKNWVLISSDQRPVSHLEMSSMLFPYNVELSVKVRMTRKILPNLSTLLAKKLIRKETQLFTQLLRCAGHTLGTCGALTGNRRGFIAVRTAIYVIPLFDSSSKLLHMLAFENMSMGIPDRRVK